MPLSHAERKSHSKFLSYILRHHPEKIAIQLDREGWANIDQLLKQAARQGLDKAALVQIVADCEKQRYEISADGKRIRAVQGHSSQQVARDYPVVPAPDTLYHGTIAAFLPSITTQGLRSQGRHYVHLSADKETAQAVGARRGKAVILTINSAAMQAAGIAFHQAENGVWLVKAVPPEFITF